MKLTRIFAFVLALIIALSLFACNDTDKETDTNDTTDTNETADTTSDPNEPDQEEYDTITIAEALELCGSEGNITKERYYIRATIKTISNAEYGGMIIADATGEISVYGTYSSDGSLKYSELDEKPYKGDEVLLYCILQNYNGTKEVQNARLIEFTSNQDNFDASEYKSATIAEARAAAVGEKLKVSGVVARITYANGMKPSGFILVQGADSIYVYDGDAAARVKIGNTVEIAASKTYWILDSEKSSAEIHGYKGCNQLEDATLISNDGGSTEAINPSLPEWTVKEIMDNPVSNDITTQIYKVTAFVNKVEGNGFTNYYINDLDEVTGSYTYTQCSGSDFTWLDEFDGKICTVYLVVLNAKSTHSDCLYRFLPIEVVDEGFTFNTDNAAEFSVKYYGITQFDAIYTGDPKLELVTSVSSANLGFENVALSYVSSDESVVSFASEDGKTVMHCYSNGSAEITVTATHNGKEFSEKVTVTVDVPMNISYISVGEAIAAQIGDEVTVKGIVGPSLVNQSGFYLIDESGVIPVILTEAELEKVQLGHEVILKGTRAKRIKDGASCFGQTNLDACEILLNNYGEHEYSTATFIEGKTPAEFYALDAKEDHGTEVYVLTVTVEVVETAYYSNINLVSGSTTIGLYCSSANQYNWLKAYAGQEVTVEVAACNWNSKNYYRGCVLAVLTEDGKVCNELNFGK